MRESLHAQNLDRVCQANDENSIFDVPAEIQLDAQGDSSRIKHTCPNIATALFQNQTTGHRRTHSELPKLQARKRKTPQQPLEGG